MQFFLQFDRPDLILTPQAIHQRLLCWKWNSSTSNRDSTLWVGFVSIACTHHKEEGHNWLAEIAGIKKAIHQLLEKSFAGPWSALINCRIMTLTLNKYVQPTSRRKDSKRISTISPVHYEIPFSILRWLLHYYIITPFVRQLRGWLNGWVVSKKWIERNGDARLSVCLEILVLARLNSLSLIIRPVGSCRSFAGPDRIVA